MRSVEQMMNMIIQVAEEDSGIRAVGMNGSRTNPNAPTDRFQDYDIVYFVTEMNAYTKKHDWLHVFGERLIMQTPEDMELYPPELEGRYSFLMLFTDGTRIDLMIAPTSELEAYVHEDTLTVMLLDKDERIGTLPAPSERMYWVTPPTARSYGDCCNEFYWLSTYVAKGLWRDEILYAHDHLHKLRDVLMQMLGWRIGHDYAYRVNVGKSGKYIQQYADEEEWTGLVETYATGEKADVWRALERSFALFSALSDRVAKQNYYPRQTDEGERVEAYVRRGNRGFLR
ncbi:aminoglycoside 6-adenylyltransferase [Geomicrobium sp. JCM 19037]|uniref:aminoglycoside 6-adenylyltransferase n=1 Tax=Geomicrobium sp. JCM 19037 TaxID=1460634 RepID=UPI00045F3562|nr:aminoglycoside 6-adenylyltransferase [Geomicrobium sp. JCM 19037]GAK04595.1 aminoglycoside 6-adenylyltransferase [Geomicrobium sp. JCM 19037]